MLKIVHTPNKVLTSPSRKVEVFDSKMHKLVKDMEVALNACVDPQGVGLAAPQVGIDLQVFLMKPTEDSVCEAFFNPVILEMEYREEQKKPKKKGEPSLEGCLSIPRIWGPVKRAHRLHLQYQTLDGKEHTKWFEGFESVIVQHEVDHLQGILFTQRVLEQSMTLYEEKNGELKPFKLV